MSADSSSDIQHTDLLPVLKIVSGMNAGQTVELTMRECVIGRDSTCDVVLHSRTISRRHALILREADGYYLEDLRSVNGTALNGQRIESRTLLANADRIQIHGVTLQFISDPSEYVPQSDEAHTESQDDLSAIDDESSSNIIRQLDVDSESEIHPPSQAGKKLGAVLQIVRNIGTSLDLESILIRIMDTLFDIFPQTACGYILRPTRPDGDELAPTIIKHDGDGSDTINPISNAVAQRVMREGSAFLSGDVMTDERLQEISDSVLEETVRSIMSAPLIGPSRTATGVIHLETNDPRAAFTAKDLEVLASVAFLAGQAVEFARLHESLVELDWRRREIGLAKEMQLHFLPSKRPRIPGYKFYHYYHAADQVAGDYFDYVQMPDGRLAVAQGDVSGKGISAALLMARLCSDVRFCLLSVPSPTRVVQRLNELICEATDRTSFITLLLAILDPNTHKLTIVNAGHPLPICRRAATNVAEELFLGRSGLPLGIETTAVYSSSELFLHPGDLLTFYTDGVSEAVNPADKMYGVDAIKSVIARTRPEPIYTGQAILADMRDFTRGHLQSDDICLVSFGRDHSGT